jgi:hypothetical protein
MSDRACAELRYLRSLVAALEFDKRALEERLTFAWQEVGRIHGKLLHEKRSVETARYLACPPQWNCRLFGARA